MLINHVSVRHWIDTPSIAQHTGRPTHTPAKRVHMREKTLGDEGNLRISCSSCRFTTTDSQKICEINTWLRTCWEFIFIPRQKIRRIKVSVKHVYEYIYIFYIIYTVYLIYFGCHHITNQSQHHGKVLLPFHCFPQTCQTSSNIRIIPSEETNI